MSLTVNWSIVFSKKDEREKEELERNGVVVKRYTKRRKKDEREKDMMW